MPHWTNIPQQSQPLAHKSLFRGPEICDLGLGGRPTWRCLKPKTPLCADLRCEMWPRAPQLVVCCVVGQWCTPHMCRCTSHMLRTPPLPPWHKHMTLYPPTVPRRHVHMCASTCGPRRALWAHMTPHCRVFAVQMQPVRVGAAPIAPQRPKICNLDGPCGVAGSQTRR